MGHGYLATGPGTGPKRRRVIAGRGRIAAAVAAGVALSVLAACTRPFTVPADVLAAIPLALGAAATAHRLRTGRTGPARVAGAGLGRLVPVAVLLVAVVAFELDNYARAPRSAHPTLSSLLDALDAHPVGKAIVFALFLLLGWYLVDR